MLRRIIFSQYGKSDFTLRYLNAKSLKVNGKIYILYKT